MQRKQVWAGEQVWKFLYFPFHLSQAAAYDFFFRPIVFCVCSGWLYFHSANSLEADLCSGVCCLLDSRGAELRQKFKNLFLFVAGERESRS